MADEDSGPPPTPPGRPGGQKEATPLAAPINLPGRPGGESYAATARALVGVPFRLHGRDARGVDCVGLVALAFGVRDVPRGYAVRTADAEGVTQLLEAAGFVAQAGGAVLLSVPGPAQCHLSVRTGRGFVHADAGLGRVVETPGLPDNIVGEFAWRP